MVAINVFRIKYWYAVLVKSKSPRSKKPRILHVITGLNVGGAERFLHTLVTGDLRDMYEHHVISMMGPGYYGELLCDAGVRVYTLNMQLGRVSLTGLWAARKIVDIVEPDLIQGWMYHGNILAQMIAKGRPTIWNIRQTLYSISGERLLTRLVIRASSLISKWPRKIVYNSHVARAQHEDFGFANHGEVIPNGFPIDKWKPDSDSRTKLREQLGVEADTPIVGYVGRFHPMKDVSNLSDACLKILRANRKIHALIIGRDLSPHTLGLADNIDSDIMRRIHFLGQRGDIDKLMPALDVCCLTSHWGEGFPNVLGEAMLCGVPCVSTDVGDASRIISDYGEIVPSQDSSALAKSVLRIIQLPREQKSELGVLARKHIVDEFSLGFATMRYHELYTTVLEAN